MIYLCCAPFPDEFSLGDTAFSLKERLGEENSEYIDKIANRLPSAASEGLYALSLLLKMLDKYLPQESRKIKLLRNENGKPYFEGSAVSFSISHSGGMVACAITDCGEIGVDIEAADITSARADGIMSRFFTQEEKEAILGDVSDFKRAWTRKEAASKMYGLSLAEYLKKTKNGVFDADFAPFFYEFELCGHPVTVCINSAQNEIIQIDAKSIS